MRRPNRAALVGTAHSRLNALTSCWRRQGIADDPKRAPGGTRAPTTASPAPAPALAAAADLQAQLLLELRLLRVVLRRHREVGDDELAVAGLQVADGLRERRDAVAD